MSSTVDSSSVFARFRSGTFWNLLAALFTQGSVLLISLLIAHVLGREVLGQYAIVYNTVLTLNTIAGLAAGYTATKFLAECRTHDKSRASRVLGLCSGLALGAAGIATVLLIAGSGWLSRAVLDAPYLESALVIAAPFVLFSILNVYQTGVLSGLEAYDGVAKTSFAHSVIHLVIYGVGVYFYGLIGACSALTASSLTRCVLFQRVVRTEMRSHGISVNYREAHKERPILVGFMLPAALGGLTMMPVQWLANVLLVNQPDGFGGMGLWSAALTLKTLIMAVPLQLLAVGISVTNHQFGARDVHGYKRAFWWNFGGMVSVALVGALAVVILGPWLLALFGADFAAGYSALMILAVAAILEVMWLAAYVIVQSQGKMWISLWILVVPRDLLILGCAYVLVPLYGVNGLALSYAIAWSFAVMTIAVVAKLLGFRI